MKLRFALAAMLLTLAAAQSGLAQNWDTSGNNLLNGSYYFRQVIWILDSSGTGTLGEAISLYGTIGFDGNGHYTISNTQVFDSNAGVAQNLPATTGTYFISSSGFGYLSHPISSGDFVYGSVARGIFIGSATESGANDLFIAAPLASPAPTNSFFKGSYTMMDFDVVDASPPDARDSQFQVSPDGNGNLGSFSVTGHIAGRGSQSITQAVSNVKYFFSNGAANVNFAGNLTSSNLIAGTKYLYFSPDGSFVFGGSPTGWDMIVGVQNSGTAPVFDGTYYQAGVSQDESTLSSGYATLDTYYGAFKANSGTVLSQQRFLDVFLTNPLDYTYNDTYSIGSDNTYNDAAGNHFVFGSGGAVRIGLGTGSSLGLSVAVQPSLTLPSSGPVIYPTGVLNAASSAPSTASVAAGELITIYGVNLSAVTKADNTFPTEVAGVNVLVNGRLAPIAFVSASQISAVIPFATTESVASIQVYNQGAPSNTVSSFVNLTAPGVFTISQDGIGTAAALHADNSPVTSAHPAQIGETVAIYVTGLGQVKPSVSDGTPGPSNPPSTTSNPITVSIGGVSATTAFTGLAPGLVGLYQINVQVPSGVTSGSNAVLTISGPDFVTSQAVIPIM